MSEEDPLQTSSSFRDRLISILQARVPTKWWGLGRGLVEMSALASIVPIASDPVVTTIFIGYSAHAAWRIWRRGSPRADDPGAAPDEPAASLLRVQDRLDSTADYLDDLGRAMPLSLTVMWFGLSVPVFWEHGLVAQAAGLAVAAGLSFVPLFLSARDGLLKAFVRWRTPGMVARPGEDREELPSGPGGDAR